MAYKVFLVEDEIVTREGIRDSVDWGAAGYRFCGEAPDGELALPQIREQRPETVITDIKMPFMDGLQLCRILKETLPDTKIIILSGHDEFKYAQEAIHIGVAEYLLKPVTAQDLITVLRKVARQLDQEHQAAERLRTAQVQAAGQRSAMAQMLCSGVRADFDQFFASYLAPLGDVDQRSRVLIDYVFTDVILSAANFLRELGGNPEELLPDLRHPEALLANVQDLDQVKQLVRQVFQVVLEYRDRQAHRQGALIAKARDYIDAHYADPDISLSSVAARVTLSPSYFSVVFSRAVGETFIEYLTNVRMRKAMELLRTTPLTSGEIAYHVGYHNPRYFYSVFRKVVGLPPNEFRRRE